MKYVDPDQSTVKLWVGRLYNFVMLMLLIINTVKSLQYEIKESSKVLRTWRGNKDVRIPRTGESGKQYSKTVHSNNTHPNATAAATASPSAADLPRPRDAVTATVERRVCSDTASTNLRSAFAWSVTMSLQLLRLY